MAQGHNQYSVMMSVLQLWCFKEEKKKKQAFFFFLTVSTDRRSPVGKSSQLLHLLLIFLRVFSLYVMSTSY